MTAAAGLPGPAESSGYTLPSYSDTADERQECRSLSHLGILMPLYLLPLLFLGTKYGGCVYCLLLPLLLWAFNSLPKPGAALVHMITVPLMGLMKPEQIAHQYLSVEALALAMMLCLVVAVDHWSDLSLHLALNGIPVLWDCVAGSLQETSSMRSVAATGDQVLFERLTQVVLSMQKPDGTSHTPTPAPQVAPKVRVGLDPLRKSPTSAAQRAVVGRGGTGHTHAAAARVDALSVEPGTQASTSGAPMPLQTLVRVDVTDEGGAFNPMTPFAVNKKKDSVDHQRKPEMRHLGVTAGLRRTDQFQNVTVDDGCYSRKERRAGKAESWLEPAVQASLFQVWQEEQGRAKSPPPTHQAKNNPGSWAASAPLLDSSPENVSLNCSPSVLTKRSPTVTTNPPASFRLVPNAMHQRTNLSLTLTKWLRMFLP
ncbi:hypothetical protein MRX96_023590 [Rhipicephalus microplus]